MTYEKKIKNNKVAILVSPGFGAGWSTWNRGPIAETIAFDKRLVKMVENGHRNDITEEFLQKLYDTDEYICTLGADGLTVQWIDKGTKFDITEYDGSESIVTTVNLQLEA